MVVSVGNGQLYNVMYLYRGRELDLQSDHGMSGTWDSDETQCYTQRRELSTGAVAEEENIILAEF